MNSVMNTHTLVSSAASANDYSKVLPSMDKIIFLA